MMQITSYINNDILPLSPEDSMEKMFGFFKKHTYTHAPLTQGSQLLGSIAKEDIQGCDKSAKIEAYLYSAELFFVKQTSNWILVLEAFAKNETNIMPVLDENDGYIGYYDLLDIMNFFKETPFLKEPGGIIIIEKGIKEYSFSEVAQIVESNNGRLLGGFISEINDDTIQITLKIAGVGLNDILQTFRRYAYHIMLGEEKDSYIETLKERSEYLKKYLNI